MFNLEQAIKEWRRQLVDAGLESREHLDELESHLREEVTAQGRSGLSVRTEFAKVEVRKTNREHKLLVLFFWAAAISIPLNFCLVLCPRAARTCDMTAGQQRWAWAAVVAFSLLMWGGRLGANLFPVMLARRRSTLILTAGVLVGLWWIVFLRVIAPGRDFTMAQFMVAFLWAFLTPLGGLWGVVGGRETAAWKQRLAGATI
jgi:hypothetical protein